ncbi:RadC family protein [Chitinivibrio alkaliphilus]|uniref:DNA repair protein RadC n=1 Tax=Chitinivibrio alkaliphilus ACht1 TaxID=1313304 RepID=U7DAP8_9BACT|nr:DNA repair protein RadC [Chitinivibrio alkaliphilus]ERP32202.1 DNA repair protein RadC [Chitinivibrio alkaliphilus ACht1]
MDTGGHRKRLLERYINHGAEALYEYELVELLLTYLIPRRDTKPLAKRLWNTYGSFSRFFAAPSEELTEEAGITRRGAALISLIRDFGRLCLSEEMAGRHYIRNKNDVHNYLRFTYAHLREEFAVILFLDNQNRVIHPRIISRGTVDHCTVYPSKIFQSAFEVRAAALLLAHNHPGGSPHPSTADIDLTRRIKEAGRLLQVELLDHIIITDSTVISLRASPEWPADS